MRTLTITLNERDGGYTVTVLDENQNKVYQDYENTVEAALPTNQDFLDWLAEPYQANYKYAVGDKVALTYDPHYPGTVTALAPHDWCIPTTPLHSRWYEVRWLNGTTATYHEDALVASLTSHTTPNQHDTNTTTKEV